MPMNRILVVLVSRPSQRCQDDPLLVELQGAVRPNHDAGRCEESGLSTAHEVDGAVHGEVENNGPGAED